MAEGYPQDVALESPEDPFGEAFWLPGTNPISPEELKEARVRFVDDGQGGNLAYTTDGPRLSQRGAHRVAPVLEIRGNPFGLRGARFRSAHLHHSGITYATYDRPGYGASTRRPRIIADSAHDIERIVDDAGWDEFSILARSGGVPHALSAASVLGSRVVRVALLAGVAEANSATHDDWVMGMISSNVERHTAARKDPLKLARDYREVAKQTYADPGSFLNTLRKSYDRQDERIISALGLAKQLGIGYDWALRQGGAGWFDDTTALQKPWEIDTSNVKAQVSLWHGRLDPFADELHSQWNAKRLAEPIVHVSQYASHFNAMQVAIPAASWAARGHTDILLDRLKEADKWMCKMHSNQMTHYDWDYFMQSMQAYVAGTSAYRYVV